MWREISLSRAWQERVFTLLVLVSASVGILGIHALCISPVLSFGDLGLPLPISELAIQKIDHLKLDPALFKRLPEFFLPKEEADWWRMQERAYLLLEGKDSVRVEFGWKDILPGRVEAAVVSMPLSGAIREVGLVYLVALLYLFSAAWVFRRHRSASGSLLAFFLLFDALYFVSSAPVVTRSFTLYPPYFKILIQSTYLSAGGLITLVHFSFVFPRPKGVLGRFPAIPYLFYGYFLVTVLLYLSGIIAFGTTFPFLCLWILVMVGALLHSLLGEEDPFLKKQIGLSLLAPLMVGAVFVLLYLLPGVVGMTPLKFTSLALFSLILPFALPSAMDNLCLYRERLAVECRSHQEKLEMEHKAQQERLEAERRVQQERERLRRDLHDGALNDLDIIFADAEGALTLLDRDVAAVREMLRSIADQAGDGAQRLRDFLWIGEGHHSWKDLCAHLRKCGNDLLNHRDIDFNLDPSGETAGPELPPLSIRVCLYRVFRESLMNVARHAHAGKVGASLSWDGDTVVILEIEDNGQGFDPKKIGAGHYGLRFMKERVEELGGTFHLETEPLRGTRIKVRLPLKNPPSGG